MQRETFEVITENGTKALLHSYITGAEKRKIVEYYLNAPESQTKSEKFFGAADLAVEIVVCELNGSKENIASRMLELPSADVEEITEKIKDIVEPKKK